jgi:transposase
MNRDHFWLTDRQFARIAPHLPTDTRGKPRVDDRRVISGIVHVLKSGARWVDAPAVYGPRKTLYNRYVRVPSVASSPTWSNGASSSPCRRSAAGPAPIAGARAVIMPCGCPKA